MMWHGFPKTPGWVVPVWNEHQSPAPSGLQKTHRGLINSSRSPCLAAPAAQPHTIIQRENMHADLPDIPPPLLPHFGYENVQNFTRLSENVPRGSSQEPE